MCRGHTHRFPRPRNSDDTSDEEISARSQGNTQMSLSLMFRDYLMCTMYCCVARRTKNSTNRNCSNHGGSIFDSRCSNHCRTRKLNRVRCFSSTWAAGYWSVLLAESIWVVVTQRRRWPLGG